jgi:Xaa-Pro dipeptidase
MRDRYRSKIGSAALRRKAEGSFGDLGPGELAVGEWKALGLDLPDLEALRAYRLARLRAELALRDCAGVVLTDPINVRYATDSTNMQLWCMHNAVRYAFVATEGPIVVFDFHGSAHLSRHLDLVDEVRPGISWFYFKSGSRVGDRALRWAQEIADLVRAHGGGSRRLAVDKANREGIAALEAEGITICDGQEIMELARAIKSPDEVNAMRCAIATCESAMREMEDKLRPGTSEQELWAHLHAGNVARGGEWIETRLLSSGPRTNPWFQECSSRIIAAGEIVAFDTDLIGPYGYCADLSRSWLCGDGQPSGRQRDLYRAGMEQLAFNLELIRPGLSFLELSAKAFQLPEEYRANRYSVICHGVGLADEYPAIYYPEESGAAGYDGVLQENMTVCLESYIGEEGGPDGIRLEQQVLITESGAEILSSYPFDERLSA